MHCRPVRATRFSVDSASVVDPDFDHAGDIDFTATGSPATVTANVKAD